MVRKIYCEEFRIEAVKQVTKNGYSVTNIGIYLKIASVLSIDYFKLVQ